MVLTIQQIKEIQNDLPQSSWGIWHYREHDLCETVIHLIEDQERLQAEKLKLEAMVRENTKTINQLILENSNLKTKKKCKGGDDYMNLDVRPSVEFCAIEMERKLCKNDHKDSWEDPSVNIWHIYDRIKEELGELQIAMAIYLAEPTQKNIESVINECADVCNFSHMIMAKVCETMRGFERGRPKKEKLMPYPGNDFIDHIELIDTPEKCSEELSEEQNCLKEANKIINGDRQDSYGNPENSFSLIAKYWDTYLSRMYGVSSKKQMLNSIDVAHMMMLLKIARMSGQKSCRDNYVDLAGYAGIAADRLLKEDNI